MFPPDKTSYQYDLIYIQAKIPKEDADKNRDIRRMPRVGRKELDLYKLFYIV